MRNHSQIPDTLNKLLAIHFRSLPMYMVWASPYRRPEDEHVWQTIQQIVDDQRALAARVVELILERKWLVDYGDFPITFTGSHDLSLRFLVRRLVQWQSGTVAAVQECCESLKNDPIAQALAEECLGSAKGHLDTLEELLADFSNTDNVKLSEPATASEH
jgi:hypothetical protein